MKVLILKTGRPHEDEAILVLRSSLQEYDPDLEVVEFDNTMTSFNAVASGKVLVLSPFTVLRESIAGFATYVDDDAVPVMGNLEVPMYQKRMRPLVPKHEEPLKSHFAISPVYISPDAVLIDVDGIATDIDVTLDFETGLQYMASDFVELGYKDVFKYDVWLREYRELTDFRDAFVKSTISSITVVYPRNIEPQVYRNDSLGRQIDMRPYTERARGVLPEGSAYLAILEESLVKCDRCYLEMDIQTHLGL